MTVRWSGPALSPIEGALSIPQDAALSAPPAAQRNAGLDALRAAMVLLVVVHHAAVTYSAAGSWFYLEAAPVGSLAAKLLNLLCAVDQSYFMGLLFLLAGYFTPSAIERHGVRGYVRERLVRLGIPLLVFGFLIGPLTIVMAQTAKGHPFMQALSLVWNRGWFESGPLWFVIALMLFTAVYMAWREIAARGSLEARAPRSFPSNLALLAAVIVTGAGAFALRLVWPVGTTVFNLQLGYFASYIVLFAAGCIGARSQWLANVPPRQRRLWLIVAAISLAFGAYKILSSSPGGSPHPDTPLVSPLGGWSAPAAMYAFWEPLVAWGAILGLVYVFQRYFAKLSTIGAALARRSYAIYVIHPPVLVAASLALRDVPAPYLVKFALASIAACLACFWIAGGLLRLPGFNRVL